MRNATLLLLLAGCAPGVRPEMPELAKRCNAVEWKIEMGSSDLFPTALRDIQRELKDAGPGIMDVIEESLEHSLNLRLITAHIVDKWPGEQSRRILLRLYRDKDGRVAAGATFYLGELNDREIDRKLVMGLTHNVPMVRHNALNALGKPGLPVGFEEALTLLHDKHHYVRHSAVPLLQHTTGRERIAKAIRQLEVLIDQETDRKVKELAEKVVGILRKRDG